MKIQRLKTLKGNDVIIYYDTNLSDYPLFYSLNLLDDKPSDFNLLLYEKINNIKSIVFTERVCRLSVYVIKPNVVSNDNKNNIRDIIMLYIKPKKF